jgi:DNA-binding response OmpR family regulator
MNHKLFTKNMQNFSILYVEDDSAVQKHISEFLKRYSKNVYLAESAEDGYQLFLKHSPDIVMLDINLPGMSGIDLAKKIRSNNSEVSIIMATAYTDKAFLLEAIELNLIRYLIKPITGDELYDALMKCVKSMSSKTELVRLSDEFSYNLKIKTLYKRDEIVPLRKKEIELLDFFVNHIDEVVTYEMLENMVWRDFQMTQDAIRSQIRNLRKKTDPKLFGNISGVGYKLAKS